ncbi:MAG: hypothetical protein GTO02_07810 [Candidatus Dadabacteria bacterium]|nr:hypothetical protein [Candidatus Dadabacteria bacterium]
MALEQTEKKDDEPKLEIKTEEPKQDFGGIKQTLYTDPNTHEKYAIPVNMSPNPTVDRILTYLNRTGFCGCLFIGMSGTGKSTMAKMFLHKIHEKKPQMVIHHYERDDIQNMSKHIEGLQQGLDHALLYDDASFSLEKLKKEDVNAIAQNLTYIRHQTKGKVLVFLVIHYSKAISRFFRNVPFAFLTSISMEEVHSFQDVWPHGRYKFRDYSWYVQQMMFNSYWKFEVDRYEQKYIRYDTDRPFRLSLALEGNMIHYMVYHKLSCSICDPDSKEKKIVNSQQLIDHYKNGYGADRARAMLRLYSFAKHGLKVIDSNRLSIWKSISEYDKNNNINWKNVNELLDEQTTRKRRKTYIKKDKHKKQMQQLESISKEEEIERSEFEQNLEQLDSKLPPQELDAKLLENITKEAIDEPYDYDNEP